ncbi:putative CENP-B [Fusarium oxysporum f. sp. albedinis]|nr:putative CENP-B [Fusarium oxysporum f. sp. albedinis]
MRYRQRRHNRPPRKDSRYLLPVLVLGMAVPRPCGISLCALKQRMNCCLLPYTPEKVKRLMERKHMEILSIIDVVLSDCTVNLTNHLLQTIKRTVIPPKKQ